MHRIVVVGNTGSGKSTLSRQLSKKLGFPYLELDSIYHQPEWHPLPEEEFRARVAEFALQPSWVIDGNYTSLGMRQLVWPVADTMVWLDLPRWVVLPRVIRRTLKRAVTREELWNGNKEPISTFIDPRPDRNVILWSIIKHGEYRRMFEQARSEIDTAHLRLYRLNSAGEARRFVEGVPVQ
jgi:adenylate kinase family enzyme